MPSGPRARPACGEGPADRDGRARRAPANTAGRARGPRAPTASRQRRDPNTRRVDERSGRTTQAATPPPRRARAPPRAHGAARIRQREARPLPEREREAVVRPEAHDRPPARTERRVLRAQAEEVFARRRSRRVDARSRRWPPRPPAPRAAPRPSSSPATRSVAAPAPPSSRRDSCARRKNSGASCSHVAPIPPCTAMFSRAACPAPHRRHRAAEAAIANSPHRSRAPSRVVQQRLCVLAAAHDLDEPVLDGLVGPIARPNVNRSFAYAIAISRHASTDPTDSAASSACPTYHALTISDSSTSNRGSAENVTCPSRRVGS